MASKPSYSTITQTVSFPTKDQAVVIDVVDDTQIKDYAFAFGKLIDPTQIRFLSRMSNNRVCVFVSTKEIADELIEKHQCLMLNNKKIPIRPLITRNKRIIFSNVCPIIPHNVIEKKLTELNIKLASSISFIRAGIGEPGFSHILSFRRQAYISPEDFKHLPDRIQIEHDDTSYWIYTSTDTLTCFICKKEGHVANKCPDESYSIFRSQTMNMDLAPDVPEFQPIGSFKRPHPPTTESHESDTLKKIPDSKGTLLSDSELSETSTECSDIMVDKNISKKPKKIPMLNIQPTELDAIENILKSSDYPLSIDEFKNYLDETFGKENTLQITLTYTEDIDSFRKMLKDIISKISSRNVKNRINRIIKKLDFSLQV
ncbi:unnamed protein product [Euphydryas editha]|uniref:CCHC-type domain-containing protein n=1 Tax=Euphydryas editha TaxID=104508 RepID=A0AAU9TVP6_EUPED|nr:unnamed protein product [Euphydryas editha]